MEVKQSLAAGICGAIFVVVHFQLLHPSLRWIWQQLRQLMPADAVTPEQRLRKTRIHEGMCSIRQKTYIMCGSLFVHILPLNVLYICYFSNDQNGSWNVLAQVAVLACVYLQHLVVATGFLKPTPGQVRLLCFSIYMQFTCFVVIMMPKSLEGIQGLQNALTNIEYAVISRCFLVIVFVDTELAVLCHVPVSFAFVYTQSSFLPLSTCCFKELQICCGLTALSMALEFLLHCRVEALLDSEEAESMLSSLRRMLRGVCDGEILLDSNLQIQGNPECLKHLLMSTADMSGKDFNRLIASDEEESFQRFIAFSTCTAKNNSQADRHAPPCLRLSLRGSMDMRVAVDMFHVPLPNPSGAEEPYHLLAVREDAETREPGPAPGEMPEVPRMVTSPTRSRSSRSSRSSRTSGSSTSSAWQPFPDLSEITLMVDVRTPQHNVEQMHLSFASPTFSLRTLVRPTDWESVRLALEGFADEAEGGFMDPGVMRNLTLRSPDGKKFCSKDVAVEAFRPPHGDLRLRLHLMNFLSEPARRAVLQGIDEK
ncbi:unnamed protein product [Effrenium voratum]|nr:unnamed protein product [Effrenium voratum]